MSTNMFADSKKSIKTNVLTMYEGAVNAYLDQVETQLKHDMTQTEQVVIALLKRANEPKTSQVYKERFVHHAQYLTKYL